MANLIRTAKSGSDWTTAELSAYNINVELQDAQTFFGMDPLPEPQVDSEFLTVDNADAVNNVASYRLLRYLDLAMTPQPMHESAVDDFASHLLEALGYSPRGRVICTRKDIEFIVCGERCHAQTDVCIVDDLDILLLVQEDKRHMELVDPEAQLVAEAIAAFQANNIVRTHSLGLPALDAKMIPGITMNGSSPIFYKIFVTKALSTAVATGQYPAVETVVLKHVPKLLRPSRRLSEGMKPLDNRRVFLQCFEAFKQFVE